MDFNSQDVTDFSPDASGAAFVDIRHMSEGQLAQLGMSQIAYVKPVPMDGQIAYAIHAADGTPMALTGDHALAIAAIIQHEMIPTLVH